MAEGSELALNEQEQADLRCLAGMMIPPSAEYGVPGADDETIFADILSSLGRDLPAARTVLRELATHSGGRFATAPVVRREAAVAALRAAGDEAPGLEAPGLEALALLHRVVLLCYYRDDRVVRALGIEPRPPFPKGFELETGDWSLLDPVRRRPALWRAAP